MTQPNAQLQRASIKSAATFFAAQVAKLINEMPGLLADAEARRLTTNLVIKAQATMEEANGGPITWEQIDASKFVMDAVKVVTLGLDAGNNECYPIPYRNTTTKKYELQCSPSAKGMIKLILQYAAGNKRVTDFRGYVIKEGDKFTLKHTPGNDIWEYDQDIFGEGKTKAYITIAMYDDGTSFVMPHTKQDIEKRRAASKSPNSPAWTKWYDEMAMAKATRRHCNQIPMQMPRAVQEALDALDDDAPTTKDITPPTIALPQPEPTTEPQEAPQDQEPELEKAPEPIRPDQQQDMSWLGSEEQ